MAVLRSPGPGRRLEVDVLERGAADLEGRELELALEGPARQGVEVGGDAGAGQTDATVPVWLRALGEGRGEIGGGVGAGGHGEGDPGGGGVAPAERARRSLSDDPPRGDDRVPVGEAL